MISNLKILFLLVFISIVFSCEKSPDKEFNTNENLVVGDVNSLLSNLDTEKVKQIISSIPSDSIKSIEQLGSCIISQFNNESERAYAIYCWIVINISYDSELTPSYVTNNSLEVATKTFESRKGVCDGISRLFCILSSEISMTPAYIIGLSPSNHPELQDPLTYGSHAWNAIKIDNEWYLLDVTWGRFVTKPSSFYLRHLPDDEKWKLF